MATRLRMKRPCAGRRRAVVCECGLLERAGRGASVSSKEAAPIMQKAQPAKRESAGSDKALRTPTDLQPAAIKEISAAMNTLLADVFGLYLKTKNFHWHMS